jgi:hypothetical protein
MVTRCRRETGTLAVVFARDGEPPVHVHAVDGRHAMAQAVRILAEHHKLRAGDRLTVELSD